MNLSMVHRKSSELQKQTSIWGYYKKEKEKSSYVNLLFFTYQKRIRRRSCQ